MKPGREGEFPAPGPDGGTVLAVLVDRAAAPRPTAASALLLARPEEEAVWRLAKARSQQPVVISALGWPAMHHLGRGEATWPAPSRLSRSGN